MITGFIRDLTVEREAEIALVTCSRRARAQSRRAYRSARHGKPRARAPRDADAPGRGARAPRQLRLRHETKQLKWSDELYRIYGHDIRCVRADLRGFLEAVHPDDRRLDAADVSKSDHSRDSRPFAFEERIVRPDGTQRSCRRSPGSSSTTTADPLRLVGCCQDITEREQSEAVALAPRPARRVVGRRDHRLVADRHDRDLESRGDTAVRLRRDRCDRPESYASWFQSSYERQLERSARERARSVTHSRRYEMHHRRKDGSVFEASVTTSAVLDRDGRGRRHLQGVRDVTSQKTVEMQLRASLRREGSAAARDPPSREEQPAGDREPAQHPGLGENRATAP